MKERYKKKFGEDTLEMFIISQEIEDENIKEYLSDILFGVSKNEERINKLIGDNLKQNWSIDRISKINLSLLKVSIYEMIYNNLPYKVAINEVVELAKRYSDDQAKSFVNRYTCKYCKKRKLRCVKQGKV